MNLEAYFKITYGLYVVSSINGKKLNGFISNTVFQVTSEPAQIAIVCSKDNYTSTIIKASNVFAISALRRETRADIIGTFGYRSGKDFDKFGSYFHKFGKTGTPILLDDVIAWFECEVVQTVDLGTHFLFIGKLIDSDLIDASADPLTYAWYRDVKKGKAPKNAPTFIDPEKLKQQAASASDKYYCTACGHIYDPAIGDLDSGIAAGTKFEDIPDNWVCPVCGAQKSDFAKKD